MALAVVAGLALAVAALGVYLVTHVDRFYDHFVWQASAFLEGEAAIRYPVETTAERIGNWFFQDVLPVGRVDGVMRGLIPFPPLPALLLVPFVAVFGLDADDQLLFTALAAVDVAICWWMIGRLRVSGAVRVVDDGVLRIRDRLLVHRPERDDLVPGPHRRGRADDARGRAGARDRRIARAAGRTTLDRPSRLRDRAAVRARDDRPTDRDPGGTVLRARRARRRAGGAPGRWGSVRPSRSRRCWPTTSPPPGQLFHPAYDHLYRLEARAYTSLGYHPDWAAEDPRYLPQNLGIMLFATPELLPERLRDTLGTIDQPLCTSPGATRGLFDVSCPLALPRDTGMSILLTSPAFLLAIPALLDRGRRRIVPAAMLAILLVSIANLMHFSQGWVQFGYRFANDTVPFALVLVAIGLSWLVDRVPTRRWAMPLAVGAGRGLGRGQRVGRGVGASPRVVTRALVTWVPPLLVGILAFVAARLALLPGLGFWDTAELQAVAPVLGTAHPTGFPTYVLLGWLANILLTPFGEPALRMNLFAALSVAVAAAVTVDLGRTLTRSIPIGVMAGLGLALTTVVWSIGTHAEAHALHLALLAILLRLLVAWEDGGRDRALVAAAVVFGLAVGNHSLTLLLAPPIALYVFAVDGDIMRRRRLVARCVAALAITVVARLPRAAAPGRAVPRAARVRRPVDLGRVLVHRPRRAVPGQPRRSVRRPGREVRRARRSHGRGVRAAGRAAAARVRGDRDPATSIRAVERHHGPHHVLLRGVVRQRDDRPLLPGSRAHRLDLARAARRRRRIARRGHGRRRAPPERGRRDGARASCS